MAALTSPGVSVSIIDQSQYVSTQAGTVPFVLLATAQDKLTPSDTLAVGTTIANANVGTWSSLLDSANGVTQEIGDYYFKLEADLSVYNSSKTYKLTVLIDGWGKVIMRLIYYAE